MTNTLKHFKCHLQCSTQDRTLAVTIKQHELKLCMHTNTRHKRGLFFVTSTDTEVNSFLGIKFILYINFWPSKVRGKEIECRII